MLDRMWYVGSDGLLVSVYSPEIEVPSICEAQQFSVSIKSVMVSHDLDGWPYGTNDLLVTSRSSMGSSTPVRRVHYYGNDVRPGDVMRDFYAETVYACSDYSTNDRLWIELDVSEVGFNSSDKESILDSFSKLAATTGAVFPAVLPYAGIASGLAILSGKLMSILNKNRSAIKHNVSMYSSASRGIPLRPGTYVVFESDVEGGNYKLGQNLVLSTLDSTKVEDSYIVFTIESNLVVSPDMIICQQLASMLTRLEDKDENNGPDTINFLTDVLKQYANYKDLKRFAELSARDPSSLIESERLLMGRISSNSDLSIFLSRSLTS